MEVVTGATTSAGYGSPGSSAMIHLGENGAL